MLLFLRVCVKTDATRRDVSTKRPQKTAKTSIRECQKNTEHSKQYNYYLFLTHLKKKPCVLPVCVR